MIDGYEYVFSRYHMRMYGDYVYWQFVAAPLWLLQFSITIQRALWRLFSVPIMVRTAFAHWRRDYVSYRQGSISGMLQALALNLISRCIGFVIRCGVLVIWSVTAVTAAVFGAFTVALVFLWPSLCVAAVLVGFWLLTATYK